jgi:hypothetical protein
VNLRILTLYSQYIFSTLVFVIKHKDLFALNMEFHSINTHHKLDLHMPQVNLRCRKKFIILVSNYLILYPSLSSKLHMTLTILNTN